jgi:transposase
MEVYMIPKEAWMEIRNLRKQGLSISEISRLCGIDRKTARKYAIGDSYPKYERKIVKESKLDPFKSYLDQRLEKFNLTGEKLYFELQKQGYGGRYGIVNKYVGEVRKRLNTKAVLRFETLPGEQAQVDWAYFGDFYDQTLGRKIRLCCFLMVLGFSRMRFIHFFDGDDTNNFLEGHNLAFKYFGGYTREILYDNLKSVVIKRAFKAKDSSFNKKFLDFSGFYGFQGILARPYKPQTKGKVENTVNFVRVNFFEGEYFYSLDEMNRQGVLWLQRINGQIHQGIHERPVDRFKNEQLVVLTKQYDLRPAVYRNVMIDSYIQYETNRYSVPYQYVKKEVSVKKEGQRIEIYYRNDCIARHDLSLEMHQIITNPVHLQGLKEKRLKFYKPRPKVAEDNRYNVMVMDLSIYDEVLQ